VLLSLEAYDHQPSCLSGQPSQVAAHLRCVGRAPVLVATTLEHHQMMRWLCRLGFHAWSNWGEKFNLPQAETCFEYQQRKCVHCGYIHERRI
jgi:hypothetical protein